MELTVASLEEAGAFTGAPVEKTVSWKIKDKKFEATVWVRRLSYHSAVGEVEAYGTKKDRIAARIASCILGKDGKPILTIADIDGTADPKRGPLDHNLTMALLKAIGEVNDLGKDSSSTP